MANLWTKFRKLSLALKFIVITGTILSTLGFLMIIFTTYSFLTYGLAESREVATVVDFATCDKSWRFERITRYSAENSDKYNYITCYGDDKSFFAKYKSGDYQKYDRYSILSKEDFEKEVKIARDEQKENSNSSSSSNNSLFSSSTSLIDNNFKIPNPTFQKINEDIANSYHETNQKAKIDQIEIKPRKIDFEKNPKPWSLIRAEFGPTSMFENYSVSKLVDANLNEVLPSFNDYNLNNSSYMRPIFVESSKTLYFPYRWGKVAVLNVETGDLKWDTFDFEIAQMSLFDGKYYLNEYKEICSPEKYSQILTCNLFEIDRSNLKDRKVALDNVKNNQIVVFADEKNVWLKSLSLPSSHYNYNSS